MRLAVGDVGRGIREALRDSHAPIDDFDAIRLGAEFDVTGVPGTNSGQGLPTVIEEITGMKGQVIVRTGTAKTTFSTEDPRMTSWDVALPGTIVAAEIPGQPGRTAG